jgi:4'-phosphopantetheinyl transferase
MLEPFFSSNRAWQAAQPRLQPLLVVASVGQEAAPDTRILADVEVERGLKIRPAILRSAYFWQHYLLRVFLGHWLDCAPADVAFQTAVHGKLQIADPRLHFNISRSGNSLAFYFGPQAGGVDIEQRRSAAPFAAVAGQHFHQAERLVLSAAGQKVDDAFFTFWTRKEALLKASGSGLVDDLAAFDCTQLSVPLDGKRCYLRSFQTAESIISLGLLDSQVHDCGYYDLGELAP